jgi:signal transduction histidine kinase/CheY-like chemotaxis protein
VKAGVYRVIAGAFGVTLLALFGVGVAAYQGMSRLVENRARVERTYAILRALDAVSARVTAAENRVRGYIITGDGRYLDLYGADTQVAWRTLAALRQLTSDNPRQRQRVEVLHPLVRDKVDALNEEIAVRAGGGVPTELEGALAEGRRANGVSIRQFVDTIELSELVLLQRRSMDEREGVRNIVLAMAVALALSLTLGLLATQVVRRDITARARAAAELLRAKEVAEAASRSKSDFLAVMSHELRTPLNSVIGFSNVLLKNKSKNLSDQDLSYLSRIVANGKHLLALINDVLDLSKVEAGRMQLERVPVNVGTLVTDTLGEFEAQARERDVTLRVLAPADMSPLTSDPVRLRQVLVNLVGNALKFTRHGTVTVRIDVDRETRCPLRLRVIDTGEGIPEERQQAIFNAFEQADSGTARRYGGTGLGLTIARSLCELLGFRLELAWSMVGLGSVFSVLLEPDVESLNGRLLDDEALYVDETPTPRETPVAALSSRLVDPAQRLVLIVDDDPDSRLLLSQYVEDFGCQAMAVSSAEQGIAAAREFRPDLIVLDLLMPGVNGWDMLKELKAEPGIGDTPVLVVSIVGGENRGSLVGAVDALDKPVLRDSFYAALRRNLESARGRVLVVSTDPDAHRVIAASFRDTSNLEVLSASDGAEALAVLNSVRPDAIVVDSAGGVADGVATVEAIRRSPRYRHVPVLILVGAELRALDEQQLRDSADAVLQWDGELERELQRALREIREGRGAGAEGVPEGVPFMTKP